MRRKRPKGSTSLHRVRDSHPTETLQLIGGRVDPKTDPTQIRAALEALRDYACPDGCPPFEPMSSAKRRRFQATGVERGVIATVEDPTLFFPSSA